MIRIAVSIFNVVALVVALCFALLWWLGPAWDWLEPAATTLPLLAVLTGIRAERWAAEREHRNQSFAALRREVEANVEALADPRFRPESQGVGQIYPRLALGAVTTALVSGAFNHKRDRALVRLLMDWRNIVEDFNRRLDLTELLLCTADVVDAQELVLLREIVRSPDGHFALVARHLAQLREALEVEPVRWDRGWLSSMSPILARVWLRIRRAGLLMRRRADVG
jgi:hypothetical protein